MRALLSPGHFYGDFRKPDHLRDDFKRKLGVNNPILNREDGDDQQSI